MIASGKIKAHFYLSGLFPAHLESVFTNDSELFGPLAEAFFP